MGGPVVCDSTLVGILTNIDTFRHENDQPVLIATRFDYYESWVYNHVNLFRRTPAPDLSGAEDVSEKIGDEELVSKDQDAWAQMFNIFKDTLLALICIIILGIVIRLVIWFLTQMFHLCFRRQYEEKRIKKVTGQPEKIHFRIIPAFYAVVGVVLAYVFERHRQLPAPRRKKIAKRKLSRV